MATQEQKNIYAKNLLFQLDKSGLSQRQASLLLGVLPQTFNTWTNAINYPKPETLARVAEFFGCRVSDLTEEKSKHQRREDSLVLIFNRLKPEGQLKLLAYGQELLKEYRRNDASREDI